MSNTTKKLSRRDAFKVLGAVAGASLLANLPSKWSTPELASGVLPAHAQTSGPLLTILRQRVDGIDFDCGTSNQCDDFVDHAVQISQPVAGIPMRWTVAVDAGTINFSPVPPTNPAGLLTGVVNTDASGVASLFVLYSTIGAATITYTWTFENPADGSGSCSATFLTPENSACNF